VRPRRPPGDRCTYRRNRHTHHHRTSSPCNWAGKTVCIVLLRTAEQLSGTFRSLLRIRQTRILPGHPMVRCRSWCSMPRTHRPGWHCSPCMRPPQAQVEPTMLLQMPPYPLPTQPSASLRNSMRKRTARQSKPMQRQIQFLRPCFSWLPPLS